jgi:class 3 adenylate cyclase/tetratricopeptide (TPR) repeat protein
MICASCGAENRESARFCDACGTVLTAAPQAREQRKTVTVLFCDVAGSTALGERLDPEALRAVMASYFDAARVAIERHGGTLEKFIGDAVMAVFGVPVVREDDALRAVRAAQDLRDTVDVDVRIGVNTGSVVTGAADSLVTGDAVNVAARLEQAADPGQVLLGAETYRLVRDAVDVELLPPLAAKGKSEPLTAYRLRAVTGDVAVARRQDAPLVGRARERRLLEDAWERTRSESACSLFTILGVAGVGKSRLAAEFLEGIDATVVVGRCLSYGDGITYWPVVPVVKQLLGDAPAPAGPLGALLGDGHAEADEIALGVRRLLEESARDRPLVAVFDDIHWGEPTFLDLVEHIADWSRDAPILLLCLARPELLEVRAGWGGGKLNATTALLEPLSAKEMDELIDALLNGRPLDDALRDRIRAAADGNPLFVEQMLAMVEESPGEVTVPGTIQALLAARLDQLPAPERAALERGAVEGQVFHRSAVAALAPDDPDVASRLLGLVRKELVRPSQASFPGDDAFRFRHLLIRDAAYEALPKATRAQLHERFAAWLEERAPELVEIDEILGYHLEQAARYKAELGTPSAELETRAAERLAAAGSRAWGRRDAGAAVVLLRRAEGLLDRDDPQRLALLISLARAQYVLGRLEESYATLDEVIERGDADLSAHAFLFRLFARGHGESISSAELERQARERLAAVERTASDVTLAQAYLTLGWSLYWGGRLEETVVAARVALDHARRAGERTLESESLRQLGAASLHGETPWDDVRLFADEIDAAGDESGQLRTWIALMTEGAAEARRVAQAYFEREGELGRQLAADRLLEGYVELDAEDYVRAEQALRATWEELGALGERGFRSTVGGYLGQALAWLGRPDEAVDVLDEALCISTPDDWVTVASVLAGRALVASARGEHEEAVRLARAGRDLVDGHEYLTMQQDNRLVLARTLAAAGRVEEAREAFATVREVAARKGSTVLVDRVGELVRELDSSKPAYTEN